MKWIALFLANLVVIVVFVAGCGSLGENSPASPGLSVRRSAACENGWAEYPHGGNAPVNGAHYDAVFFKNYGVNPFVDADEDPLSTFAVDVDTASYTVSRRFLTDGRLPPEDAVRVEEFVNAFSYDYPSPFEKTFVVHLEGAPSPLRKGADLVRIGIKGLEIPPEERLPAVLTFVIDVSGSMAREDRLGLVKRSLEILIDGLKEKDRIGIVVYGTNARCVIEPTGAENRGLILSAIRSLQPEGATNAEEGLVEGYAMAGRAFSKGAINRVILCSDGVANVGRTGAEGILERVREHAEAGITLTALGFGMGNYNDVLMEQLGDRGDGHYAYVDRLAEARRLFEEGLTGTLQVLARDVKVQVSFDPEVVRSYRLLGYENRDVADEDFRNDAADGGEVGMGHAVTALYEVKRWPGKAGKIAEVRVRYRAARGDTVTELRVPLHSAELKRDFGAASRSYKLAVTAALFAEVLRKSSWVGSMTLSEIHSRARDLSLDFAGNPQVQEFAALTERALSLSAEE